MNITIHQLHQPPWVVKNFPDSARTIHLSFHDGEHYNSVRQEGDEGTGPAEFTGPLAQRAAKADFTDADVERVCMCTGCWDRDRVRSALARGEEQHMSSCLAVGRA